MFRELSSVYEAERALIELCRPVTIEEEVDLDRSIGRVLSRDIISSIDLPFFDRAAMDGYAVRSAETVGGTPLSPAYLELGVGAVPIRTGAPIPVGFDAVLMKEDSLMREDLVEAFAHVHPSRNVSRAGEDVSCGSTVLSKGHRMRPADIALLGALGIMRFKVFRLPRVAIIPTGGELVPLDGVPPLPGQAREVNGLMARLYVEMWGGEARLEGIVPDDPEMIRSALEASARSDLILLSGGTSIGDKDYAPGALDRLLYHGLRLTPGKPTAIGTFADRPVICLPGYPVAALAALYLLVRPAVKRLAHLNDRTPTIKATLSRKIASRPGYTTFSRVSLDGGFAHPIMSTGAGILSSAARADGFVLVPEDLEGLDAGEAVVVHAFE